MDSLDMSLAAWEDEGGAVVVLGQDEPISARDQAINDFINSRPIILLINLLIAGIIGSIVAGAAMLIAHVWETLVPLADSIINAIVTVAGGI